MKYYADGSSTIDISSAYLVTDEKGKVLERIESIGESGDKVYTNNEEEYRGVITALTICQPGDEVYTDSMLVVNQVSGKWGINAEHLRPLCEQAQKLAKEKGVYPKWIKRDFNLAGQIFEKGAIEMSDEIIKTGEKTGVKVEEYKGIISLSAQREGNGKYWAEWAKYRKGKDAYQEKDWPVKVTLGTKENALEVLRQIAVAAGVLSEDVPF
jgi:ribonuclease HI